jgi:hypothetical protein
MIIGNRIRTHETSWRTKAGFTEAIINAEKMGGEGVLYGDPIIV